MKILKFSLKSLILFTLISLFFANAQADAFDFKKQTQEEKEIAKLLNNKNIIRNKLKISASINNAKIFLQIQKEFKSFNAYVWGFTNGKIIFEPYNLRTT